MSRLDSVLFLHDPAFDVSVDATTMGIEVEALDALPLSAAFDAMAALEAGAVANPDEGRQVGHYWLRRPDLAPTLEQRRAVEDSRTAVVDLAAAVASGARGLPDGGRFSHVVHVGIGGSALGPRLVVASLAEGQGLPVVFLDNTDPDGIARLLDDLGDGLDTALIVVASKSGTTPETANALALVVERLAERGEALGPRAVAITGSGSALDQRARAEGWIAVLPLWDWVGGRTSVTGSVGLLPAALAGVDIGAFLDGARRMDEWTRRRSWRDNPAALLAGCWYLAGEGRGDRHMVVLPYADRLVVLSRYLQQLVMESLGQARDLEGRDVHQGLTVFGNKGSTDQHAFVQQLRDGRDDFFVTFVQVLGDGRGSALEVDPGVNAGDMLQGFLLGTRGALVAAGRPSLVLTVSEVAAAQVGALIALFERAVGLYASLIGINAYHQPGVEAGKKAATGVIQLSRRIRGLLGPEGQTATDLAASTDGDPVEVFYLLQRLVATGRAEVDGVGVTARFRGPLR